MRYELHNMQLRSSEDVELFADDLGAIECQKLRMAQPTRIHTDKSPKRIHFIEEWMNARGLQQVDLIKATGADKGTVSKWVKEGNVPRGERLALLAELFKVEIGDLFRHPDDDWMARLLRGRTPAEKEQMRKTLEFHFPIKVA